VALYPQKNRLMIEHLTSFAWLIFVIYVYFCCRAVKINNLTCHLIYITCMSTWRDQRYGTK
jgi:hypothetical protein